MAVQYDQRRMVTYNPPKFEQNPLSDGDVRGVSSTKVFLLCVACTNSTKSNNSCKINRIKIAEQYDKYDHLQMVNDNPTKYEKQIHYAVFYQLRPQV